MTAPVKIARVYLRVSTDQQDLERQEQIVADAKSKGFYVAGVYREKASGARADRPELLRMIADLQNGEVVIAEKIDRISRLPVEEAKKLIETIKSKGARLSIPDVVDLSDVIAGSKGMAKEVLDAVQKMLLNIALQMAHDDFETRRERQAQGIALAKKKGVYTGRKADDGKHELIRNLRAAGNSIAETAKLAKCSLSLVKLVCRSVQPEPGGG